VTVEAMADQFRRIEQLEELLYDIALMADGHKRSTLYVDGSNVALVNIRNMAAAATGRRDQFHDGADRYEPRVVTGKE
jgi:hypothetical protein